MPSLRPLPPLIWLPLNTTAGDVAPRGPRLFLCGHLPPGQAWPASAGLRNPTAGGDSWTAGHTGPALDRSGDAGNEA